MNKPKILFFVPGPVTPEQKAEAQQAGVTLRDPGAWHDGDFVEPCDAVAGDVPAGYAHLPRWDEPRGTKKAKDTLQP